MMQVVKQRELAKLFEYNGMNGINVTGWRADVDGFDARFELDPGGAAVTVYADFVTGPCTSSTIARIAPWVRRVKAMRPGVSIALICDYLSPPAQQICRENGIDFIDRIGNVSINVPGRFTLERTASERIPRRRTVEGSRIGNPFARRSSRVLRVLLREPRTWRLTDIADELTSQTSENPLLASFPGESETLTFQIDVASISRTLRALEEEMLIRRRGKEVVVSEPESLLRRWAAAYAGRANRTAKYYASMNPFGDDVTVVARNLREIGVLFALTSTAAAAALKTSFVDLETIDLYVANDQTLRTLQGGLRKLRRLSVVPSSPPIRITTPYDAGVFMYATVENGTPVVDPIQAYLDLCARGSRDRKQADFLLERVIRPRWKTA